MNRIPFFSVCIPTYNRAQSLRRAIKSVLAQSFDDYEIVVTDNRSPDDTEKIVRSMASKTIHYFRNETNIGMVGNWSKALGYAKGEYVAFLFDDDEFTPNHLNEAHKILRKHRDLGIYAAGNQTSALPWQGFITAKDYFRYIYSIRYVSTPSETIFKRAHKKIPYTINKAYIYCPEVELYLEVAGDGFAAYHSPLQSVVRHSGKASNSNVRAYTWTPFVDKFAIIEKYKRHRFLAKKDYKRALKLNAHRAFEKYAGAKIKRVGEPEKIFQGIKKAIKRKLPFTYIVLCAIKTGVDLGTKFRLLSLGSAHVVYRIFSK